MTMLWLNETIERLPAMGFRTRILACAAGAAAIPLAIVATSAPATILAIALAAVLWFLFCLSRLLLPIREAARAAQACADGRPLPDLAYQHDDEIGRLTANIRAIAHHRLGSTAEAECHPTASLPTDSGAFFESESVIMARERFSLEQDLRRAVGRDELELHYQPVVDVGAGRLAGAEALVRWRHPQLGMIPPIKFVAILEEAGLVDEVDRWILNAACTEARAWEDKGPTGLKMAVSLSARQLRDPALKATIVRTMELHRLRPESIELELTETAAMEDMERTHALFTDLHALGLSLAVADFGSGYSSLGYVKNLPFNKLKIDRKFVTGVDRRTDSQAVCRALIELTRGLSIAVLAEGVEMREEVETLRGLGCAMFQGSYFSRPLTAETFATTVRDPNWLALLASPVHRELAGLKTRMAQ